MSLLKMKLKAAVLMGIAGVLMFSGAVFADAGDVSALKLSDAQRTGPTAGNISIKGTGAGTTAKYKLLKTSSGSTTPTLAELAAGTEVTATADSNQYSLAGSYLPVVSEGCYIWVAVPKLATTSWTITTQTLDMYLYDKIEIPALAPVSTPSTKITNSGLSTYGQGLAKSSLVTGLAEVTNNSFTLQGTNGIDSIRKISGVDFVKEEATLFQGGTQYSAFVRLKAAAGYGFTSTGHVIKTPQQWAEEMVTVGGKVASVSNAAVNGDVLTFRLNLAATEPAPVVFGSQQGAIKLGAAFEAWWNFDFDLGNSEDLTGNFGTAATGDVAISNLGLEHESGELELSVEVAPNTTTSGDGVGKGILRVKGIIPGWNLTTATNATNKSAAAGTLSNVYITVKGASTTTYISNVFPVKIDAREPGVQYVLDNAVIVVDESDPAKLTYSGDSLKPPVTVSVAGVEINSNFYDLIYKNNLNATLSTTTPANLPVVTLAPKGSRSVLSSGAVAPADTFAIEKLEVKFGWDYLAGTPADMDFDEQTVEPVQVLSAWLSNVGRKDYVTGTMGDKSEGYVLANANGVYVANAAPAATTTGGLFKAVASTKTTTALGTFTLKYIVMKNDGSADSVAWTGSSAPANKGMYKAVYESTAGNDNVYPWQIQIPYELDYSGEVATPFNNIPKKEGYKPSASYQTAWPTLNTAYASAVDTIILTGAAYSTTSAGLPTTAPSTTTKLKQTKLSVTKPSGTSTPGYLKFAIEPFDASATAVANNVGFVRLFITARGRVVGSATNKVVWETDTFVDVEIEGREITADMVKVLTDTELPVTYTGAAITWSALTSKFYVQDSVNVLTGGDFSSTSSSISYREVAFVAANPTDAQTNLNRVDAGTGYIVIEGRNNYKGRVIKEFNIQKAPLSTPVTIVKLSKQKVYNGSASVDTNSTIPGATAGTEVANPNAFVSLVFGVNEGAKLRNGGTTVMDTLRNAKGYFITSAAFGSANADTVVPLTVKFKLNPADSLAKNYRLASDEVTVVLPGQTIAKRTLTDSASVASVFNFSIPQTDLYTNVERGITSPLALRTGVTAADAGTATVKYTYAAGLAHFNGTDGQPFVGDTTKAPKNAGTYPVKVVVSGGKNVTSATSGVSVGNYVIGEPKKAVITKDLDATATTRQGVPITLEVTATSPNGTLSYKWYRYVTKADNSLDSNQLSSTTNRQIITPSDQTTYTYAVKITNTAPGLQVAADIMSTKLTLTVGLPPTPMTGAVLTVDPTAVFVYTGDAVEPKDEVTVTLPDTSALAVDGRKTLTIGTDYTLEYWNNTEVGSAGIRAVGAGDYVGSALGSFAITKRAVDMFSIKSKYGTEPVEYTGSPISAEVGPAEGMTGLGAVTHYYDGDTTTPTNVGNYALTVKIADGKNFTGTGSAEIFVRMFNIVKKSVTQADSALFTGFTIPKDHLEGDSTVEYGITGTPALPGTGSGALAVSYRGVGVNVDSLTKNSKAGAYQIWVTVAGGANYEPAEVRIGTYTILAKPDAVKSNDRVIPGKTGTAEAAVAPVKVVASGFTAGPSPVSKGGVIKFFSTKSVKSGSLYVFDQNGNAVAKLSAKSGTGNEIGSWVANASEGTYVVKGALLGKDGTREKVSFVFAVVR